MRTKNTLKSVFGVAFIAVLLSCDSANNPSALVGHWLHVSGSTDKKPMDIELFKDGTGVCDGGSISWKVENKRFIIQSASFGMASDYEVLDYKLTLSDNGVKSTYVDINKNYLQKGSFTDSRDKKKYGTIKIGSQTWMSENLNYEADGICYGNDPANCQKYGRLYDWKTALNVCPKSWHLPSDSEWQTLVDFAGGDEIAGKNLKARIGWDNDEGKSGNGTDIYGFSALLGGTGDSSDDFFGGVGEVGFWWSSTEDGASNAYYRDMHNYDAGTKVIRFDIDKARLFSVRCIQD